MLMFILDPLWSFLLAPSLALAFWSRRRVRKAEWSALSRSTTTPWTGGALAAAVAGEGAVVVRIDGPLTDLFDPIRRLVRLSSATFDGTSLNALAVAAREAAQARSRLMPSRLRLYAVVLLRFLVMASWLFVIAGFLWVDLALVLDGSAMMALGASAGLASGWLERNGIRAATASLVELGAFPPDELAALVERLDAERWRASSAPAWSLR